MYGFGKFLIAAFGFALAAEGSPGAGTPAAPRDRVLEEWSFAKDLAGWRPNGEVLELRHHDGAVSFRAAGLDPIIDGPPFAPISAANRQVLELVLRNSPGGRAQVFFTSTDRGPYGGFKEEWSAFADLPEAAGEARVTVRPFWEALGTVSRLRLDPPPGEMAIESIRIIEREGGGAEPLRGILELALARDAEGLSGVHAVASGWGAAFLVPVDGIEASKSPILLIDERPGSSRISSVLWASDEAVGLSEAGPSRTVTDPRGREVLDLSGHPGWKGKITHVGVRFGGRPGDAIDLSRIRIASAPADEPRLALLSLGPKRAVNRPGIPFEIEARLENQGGMTQHSGDAVLVAFRAGESPAAGGPGGLLEIAPRKAVLPAVRPGETARLSFFALAREPGRVPLVLEAGGMSFRGEVRIDPPLPAGRVREGELPPATPIDTSHRIGIYYFPGWSPDQWTRWKGQVPFPERSPELGFYREGDPAVMDWQIRWAVENGISFFIFDWYWRDGKVALERGLHQGFLEAGNRSLMKFAVLWANHDPFAGHGERQLLAVTDFWIENYFRRPEYLLLDGRPAVFFFDPSNLERDLGGSGAVRRAFDALRARARAAGLAGLWIAACGRSDAAGKEAFAREGYDAVTAYNHADAGSEGALRSPYATLMAGHRPIWDRGAGDRPIPAIPVLTVGWDSRPWHGVKAMAREGRTAAAFEAGLRSLKDHLDRTGGKVALLEAWNELGEGSDIEPTVAGGFELLEAVRAVFGKGPFPANIVPRDLGLALPAIDPDLIGGWDPAKVQAPVESRGRCPAVREGLSLRCEGDTLTLLPGRVEGPEGAREIKEPRSFRIAPAPAIAMKRDFREVSPEPVNRWLGGTRLLDLAGRPLLPGALAGGSIEVRAASGAAVGPGRSFLRGRDWVGDDVWGAISRLPGGALGEGAAVEVSYRYGLTRIDSIAIDGRGEAVLLEGTPHTFSARPPAAEGTLARLFNVWLPYHHVLLDPDLIYPVGAPAVGPFAAEAERGSRAVARSLGRLRAGEGIRLLFWGDSVTAGGDASSPAKTFPARVGAGLEGRFPGSKVEVLNAGVGGSSSPGRLARFEDEVLARKPDLVVVEFVNDMGLPVERMKETLGEAIDRLRGAGAEVILATPHFTLPAFMGRASWRGPDPRPGVQAIRDLAAAKGVGLADVARAWERLEAEGVPYLTLLANGINHPDDDGHAIYAGEVLRLFPAQRR